MDTRFDKNEAELGIFVFPVVLEVVSDGDGLFHEARKVLRVLRGES